MNADVINKLYYGDAANPTVQRCRERIHWICRQVQGRDVLDVGCSQGIVCLILAREGFHCTGIDLEQPSLDYALTELQKESEPVRARVDFRLADATALPFADDQFDTVILGEILEHLAHPAKVLQEVRRVLREGGRMVGTVPFGLLPFHDHKRTFYPVSFVREVEPFFRLVEVELPGAYIAVTGVKDSSETRTSNLNNADWLARLVQKTEEQLFKNDNEHHRITTQLNQRITHGTATAAELNKTISDLKAALAEKERAAQAALTALEARWRDRFEAAEGEAESRRKKEREELQAQIKSVQDECNGALQQLQRAERSLRDAEAMAAELRDQLKSMSAERSEAEIRWNSDRAAFGHQLQAVHDQLNAELRQTEQANRKLHDAEREAAELRDQLKSMSADGERRLAAARAESEAKMKAAIAEAQKKLDAAQKSAAAELHKRDAQQKQWQKTFQALAEENNVERDRLQWEHQTALELQAGQLKRSGTWRTGAALVGAGKLLKEIVTHPVQFGKTASARLRAYYGEVMPPAVATAITLPAPGVDDLVRRIRTTVSAATPLGATVAVISRGDDRLLDFVGRTGWHYPRTREGAYAGHHPADSAEAMAHLEQLRAAGAGYLVVPCTSFWWLDFYAEFRLHLTTHCHCVAFQDDTCAVFALQAKPPEFSRVLTVHYNPKASGQPRHHDNCDLVPPEAPKPTPAERTTVPTRVTSTPAVSRQTPLLPAQAPAVPAPAPPRAFRDLALPPEDAREFEDGRQLYHLFGASTHTDESRVLLYGNVNTNAIDGSSVWLINVAKMLSLRYKVDLLLKAKITTRYLLSELESNPNIRLIPPDAFPLHAQRFGDTYYLEDYSAAELLTKLDMQHNYRFVLCRGKFVNYYLSLNPRLNRKLVAYFLIDYYKFDNHSLDTEVSMLHNIIANARVILAQTQMLSRFMCEVFQCPGDNIVLLPPMVGDCVPDGQTFTNRRNICLYAGKFDTEWRIEDILNVCENSACTLQLVGNKFHQQHVGAETLKAFVLRKAQTVPNIKFLGAVDHKDMPARMDEADFSISVRTDKYLASKEFSTKVLEFGARGKPTIVNDSPINRFFLGDDFPLFANTNEEMAACLEKVKDPAIYDRAARMCYQAAMRSRISEVAMICDRIEAHLKPQAVTERVAVLSDDKAYLDRFTTAPSLSCQTVKVLFPRVPGIRHEPLSRLFRWADVIDMHVAGAVEDSVISLLNETGKKAACTARRDLGLRHQVACSEGWRNIAAQGNGVDVSVIVPCKDVETKMVERALKSVADQGGLRGKTCEVILVDDHSQTPIREAIAAEWRNHPQIRFVRNSQNKGLGLSRNIGLEWSRGSRIFFLDADDYYSPDFIAAVCAQLEFHDVVFSQMVVHRENDNVFDQRNYVNEAVAELRNPAGDQTKVITATSACVKGYRRDALEAGRLFFGVGYHEDVFPWLRFTVENPRLRIGCAESAVYYRTIRKGSAQITENPEIVGRRMQDLNRARQAVLGLLRHHNTGGSYAGLIARYEKLITADAMPTSPHGAP